MTSLSSSASTSAKTVNNNAQKNISVSVCEKNAFTAVNGHKKAKTRTVAEFLHSFSFGRDSLLYGDNAFLRLCYDTNESKQT